MSDFESRNMVINFILNRAEPGDLRVLADAYEKRRSREGKEPNLGKAAGKRELLRAVNFIMKGIDDEDLVLVKSALERRMAAGKKGKGGLDSLVLGMGMGAESAMKSIHKGARMLAADIILQHHPDIPDSHLNALLDEWVPSPGRKKKGAPVPADVMLAMIEQFVAYGAGAIPADELKKYPSGWAEKYWDAFSTDVRKLIASYLKGETGRDLFWSKIREILARG